MDSLDSEMLTSSTMHQRVVQETGQQGELAVFPVTGSLWVWQSLGFGGVGLRASEYGRSH